jgi:hypothetical protein
MFICSENLVHARYAMAQASAPTTVKRVAARSVADERYASITTKKRLQEVRGLRHLPPQTHKELQGDRRLADMRA